MPIRGFALLVLVLAACNPPKATPPAPIDTSFLTQYAETNKFTLGRPSGFRIARDGGSIFFMRSKARSFERDLYVYDVASKKESVLATASQLLNGGIEVLTPEERAKRERMRMTAKGIARFDISPDGQRVLIPLSGKLYLVDRKGGQMRELTDVGGAPDDASISPDGNKVACVRNGDLYVIDIATNVQTRLTTTANDNLQNGLADFIAAEEMDRFRGYWWSPDSGTIVYQETDTKDVDRSFIADPTKPDQAPDSKPYPRPGRPNASVRLGLVDIRGGATRWVSWDRATYPYLASVRWSEGAPLTMFVQNRAQTECLLLEVELGRGATRTLLKEQDEAWVNIEQSVPRFFDSGRRFLWISEHAGAPVLEIREASGVLQKTVTAPELGLNDVVFADDQTAWIRASKDATDTQLFRVTLATGETVPVSPERGRQNAFFADDAPVYVHTMDLENADVRDSVRMRDGSEVGTIDNALEPLPFKPNIEFTRVGSRDFNALVIRPHEKRSGKLPVIVHVYGGPGHRQVERAPRRYMLDQWYADQGFIVVSVDNRGTPGRGREWERAIKNEFISVPLADQVDGLKALIAKYPELDGERVGIYGWSFGGYATAHAVMQHPELYKAGVSGGSVTDWRDYDTHYTERYIGQPESSPEAYGKSSVFTYVPKLERPLLLVHGTADDNVYFAHTLKLCDALFRAGKPFDLIPLVNTTHMVPQPEVERSLDSRIVEFFRRHL